ncbi:MULTISPECIES: LexA family transcriptional regulator [Sphingomonas]|jgi:phage repressor protein C with HTH and peptisase S24 domain|uniref:Uncharacterized protein n=1 Tax=Sphingomonas melonis TY TaxID=621456 RepID=A0A175Y4H3_9SPHN|nr:MULTISPECIES: helix-turn-helix transcriptional regulator [Sphingomonas]AOW25453.1 hypothetical protein BJP26_03420 [Sphingomonas melonis TY]ATI57429.1 hypothetical protein CP552_10715 [Sphingomonas melonis]KZB95335.1 hypothetical protein AVM11_03410 [Sphingomonas melonis TY]MBX8845144.1 helix-turn-helix transcriptional regulator [Sphingomonas melonis]MBX8854233.1 helix-turn-helix transcriptional regulator [Sphingomonas melonis]
MTVDVDHQSMEDRIAAALGHRDYAWLSHAAGIPISTLNGYRRKGFVKTEAVIAIAAALEVSLDWLLLGRGEMRDGHVATDDGDVLSVPEFDIEVAAGAGRFSFDRQEPMGYWPFPSAWLAQFGNPKHLKLVTVVGDSQEPEFGDGDRVLVDTSANRPRDGMHVVRRDGTLLVKRLQMQGATIVLKSANPVYTDIVVEVESEEGTFEVLGRVVGAIKVVGNPWRR